MTGDITPPAATRRSEPTAASPDPAPRPGVRRFLPSRWGRALPWVLAVLAIAAAAFSTIQWRDLAEARATRQDVAATASSFLVTLTNWDATDGLADTREALRQVGSGRFLEQVDELFGGTEDLAGLEAIGATSAGDVQDLFVQEIRGDQAQVFAVVVQRVSTADSEQPTRTDRFAQILLAREGGAWRIENVDLIADIAPGGGPTAVPERPADETGTGS